MIEGKDLKFNTYLNEKTNYNIDVFKAYYEKVERIIKKGIITTDNQYYDISNFINELCQLTPVDSEKVEILNVLIRNYEQQKSLKKENKTYP